MTYERACEIILGKQAAVAIIKDQGLHWAMAAAVAACMNYHDDRAKDACRRYLEEIRK